MVDRTLAGTRRCHDTGSVDLPGPPISIYLPVLGAIPADVEPILDRIGFDESTWLEGIKLFGQPMFQFIGPANMIRQAAEANQRSWYRGITACHAVFGRP